MITLKDYQRRALEALSKYFQACQHHNSADMAFYDVTRQTFGTGIPFREVKELPGLPYVCLRIPTGGGKTVVACHSIGVAANDLMHTGNPVVLWLVPSNAIKEQTINALKDRNHFYRKAIEETMPSVEVLSIQDALFITRPTLSTNTTIIVSTKQGSLFELFEDTHFHEIPWALSKCSPHLAEEEYSSKLFDGKVIEIDISDKGQFSKKFLVDLHEQMTLLGGDHDETVAQIVHWLDQTIPHRDILPSETGAFLTALVLYLVEERKFELSQLFHDKYTLRQRVSAKIDKHRTEARQKAYQALLLPECKTPLVVTPGNCFSFNPHEYPYNTKYAGTYELPKHYYKDIGSMNGEEEACAVFIDQLPEVEFWVRNIERRENHSFWLQTSTDKFYPDFVCKLKDGRFLAVEYKGADRWSDDDSKEKRALGELWEMRSNGTCLFVMPKGKDLQAIKAKL